MRKYLHYYRGWSDRRFHDAAYLRDDRYPKGRSPVAVSDEGHFWRDLCRERPSLLTTLRADVLPAYLALGRDAPRSLAALLARVEEGEGAAEDFETARTVLTTAPDADPSAATTDPRRPVQSLAAFVTALEADAATAARFDALRHALYSWAASRAHELDNVPEIIDAALATLAGMAGALRAASRIALFWLPVAGADDRPALAAMVAMAARHDLPYAQPTANWLPGAEDDPPAMLPTPRESRPVSRTPKGWRTFNPGAWLARLILTPDAPYAERRETYTGIAADAGVSYPFVMRKVKALADRYRVAHLLERHARTSRRSP